MIILSHRCVCGHDWTAAYEPGSEIDPTCPVCDKPNRIVRPGKKGAAWYESISSTLDEGQP